MLFFIRLGLKNAWRNIGRSTAALLAMSLACAVLTYTISLGRGRIAGLHASLRSMVGGDISIYAELIDAGNVAAEAAVRYELMRESPLTDLAYFHEECFEQGYLTTVDTPSVDLLALQSELLSYPGVKGVMPRYQFPVLRLREPQGYAADSSIALQEVNLRGRSLDWDAMQYAPPAESITAGRWFEERDEGRMVCIISAYQPRSSYVSRAVQPGDIITLQIPKVFTDPQQGIDFDFSRTQTIELEVIGLYGAESRQLPVNAVDFDLDHNYESLYWEISDIYVPMTTWQNLWDTCSDLSFEPQQLALLVEDLGYVNDTLSALRQGFPEMSSFSVVDQAERLRRTMEHETVPMYASDSTYLVYEDEGTGGFIQADLRLPIVIALFGVAALVVAAHLLILVAERKNEIATLKAIGSQRIHIMIMIIAEMLCITWVSGTVGFLLIRVQMLLNQLVAGSGGIGSALLSMGADLIIVLGISLAVSVLFGLLPAVRTARLPVMEVLRHE